MKSRINPRLIVTPDNWVVSLVRKGFHANIVVESVGYQNDPGLGIRWYDFVLKNDRMNFCLAPPALMINKKYVGEVRCGGDQHNYIDDGLSCSREELFKWKHWDEDKVVTWLCPKKNALALMADIEKDIDTSTKTNDFILQIRGKPLHNCSTWTVEKLHTAGIEAIRPKHHIYISARSMIGKNISSFFHQHKGENKEQINAAFTNRLSPVTEPVQVPYRPTK